MVIFKVGNSETPASQNDIDSFEKKLSKSIKDGTALVTHHAVDVIFVPDGEIFFKVAANKPIRKKAK